MSNTLSAIALVACSWSNPGVDPYIGTPEYALKNLPISYVSQQVIARKIRARHWDDRMVIDKYHVIGDVNQYRDMMWMFFGKNKLCYGVDRSKWQENQTEEALVYCSDIYCVAVPNVCGNITQVWPIGIPKERSYPDNEKQSVVEVHTVPEPSTLLLLFPFLGYLIRRFK